ncbi:MAG TPA: AbrB/MazE/SpoVT family DNA-binding domain-containing protein [Paraburkholderia sp.]|jgi:AbrB family looped-hinge helix DNA binding protein|uniref:AbrB/MazE/SpoVT family DNA-binding domain-containing protein n=1 Tax=Paraburkholderia sp. TaxID=1926495 RepID=UPI002DEE9D7E|nr:AbrB/MazE/SpoVT family DNA-binding domain-containing protein [Paraburkholderia sp.]
MASATLTSKGQITIPADVRTHLGLSTGDRVEFILNESTGRYEVVPATCSVTALKGIVRKPRNPVSIDEMNEVIAREGSASR